MCVCVCVPVFCVCVPVCVCSSTYVCVLTELNIKVCASPILFQLILSLLSIIFHHSLYMCIFCVLILTVLSKDNEFYTVIKYCTTLYCTFMNKNYNYLYVLH